MLSRRSWLALVLGVVCVVAVAVPFSFSGAASTAKSSTNSNENNRTIVLSLPGPFNACTYLDAGASPTTDSILDLIEPSAFLTQSNGVLAGEDGAISSAELTSLSPETVRYTIEPKMTWSNGVPFTGADLVSWWQQARALASVKSVGYRAIKSLVVSKNGLSVTATFATPYADWDLLFRDVEEPGSTTGCALQDLAARPTLGPYTVTRVSANRIVLAMNPKWPIDTSRFGRVVITDTQDLPSTASEAFVDYDLAVNRSTILTLSSKAALSSKIASSANIEEMTFSPTSALTDQLAMREALSWSVGRVGMIDKLFGAVTYEPSAASSAIFSQGQADYPGGAGSNPVGQTTTTTTAPPKNTLSDCVSCAIAALKGSGYVRTSTGWVSSAGKKLTVRLGVGPSALDHSAAALVRADWTSIGVSSTAVYLGGEIQAAEAAADGDVDVALFVRPTTTTPAYSASSWAGPAYPDTYPSGVRLAEVTKLFDDASVIFNPVTASTTWLELDQVIMNDFWVRPLFTAPSLIVWSTSLSTIADSVTIPGFVDQLPTWSELPANTIS